MFISAILFSLVALTSSANLPPEITQCKSSDTECLKSSAENVFLKLKNGNKEFGIPPLEPINMGSISVESKPGAINIFQKYEDITLKGLSTSKVKDFTVDLKACRMNMDLLVPEMEALASYELKGQLLIFPVDAKGDCIAKLMDMAVHADASCETFKEQDTEYLRLTSATITIASDRVEFQLGNLINGNEQLEKEVHKVIDDDPLAFFEVIRPTVERSWSDILKRTVNNVFEKVPRKDLFKD